MCPFLSIRIITLSFVLACGFLLVILSCALYNNWWPLFVIGTYVVAPIPNAVCARCGGSNDIMSDESNTGLLDLGRFLTGILVMTGFSLPFVLAHAEVISIPAMIMSIGGGILVYTTIITYGKFFAQEEDEF
ncbi:uncharacterized protein VTP21DRAFT_9542 [Calcarisporiella thermophila]|uniref:uncharacterized protein n=1 Tax=Calcarisporiella thermophila TaxID=911321 RepID=UPI003742CEEB